MPKAIMELKEARLFLEEQTWGRLALISPDGPYIIPMHYVLVEDTIYFHAAARGKKLECLKHSNSACFEVSQLIEIVRNQNPCNFSTRYNSVQVFGKAFIVDDPAQKINALNWLTQKYAGPNTPAVTAEKSATVAVIALNIERISGKKNIAQ